MGTMIDIIDGISILWDFIGSFFTNLFYFLTSVVVTAGLPSILTPLTPSIIGTSVMALGGVAVVKAIFGR